MTSRVKFGDFTYKGQKDMEDILNWIWNLNEANLIEAPVLQTSGKSEAKSSELRLEGNRHFKKKNFEKALEFYNLSVMVAPHPVLKKEDTSVLNETESEDDLFAFPLIDPSRYGGIPQRENETLAKGFANRSAVMMELSLYEICLQDINLALEYGYPKELHNKLESRKERCIYMQKANELGEGKKDQREQNSTKENNPSETLYTRNTDSDSSKTSHFLYHTLFSAKQESPEEVSPLKSRLITRSRSPPNLAEPNPYIPSLSRAVKVFYNPLKGRGITAVRDIHPGEVLGVERAYCGGLDQKKLTTHCSTCFCLCLTPLPCPGCSHAIFCSKSCRTRGLAEDHWLDCKILPSLISVGMDTTTACKYKLLKTFSCQQLKTIVEELGREKPNLPEHLGFSSDAIYSSTSYRSVYYLRQDTEECPLEVLLRECQIAFGTTKLLEMSGRYFVNDIGELVTPTKRDFLDTCKTLVRNTAKKSFNAFNLAYSEGGCWGMFPSLSLFNHSCNPSAVFEVTGRIGFLFTMKPITAGEEVTISYTEGHNDQAKEGRAKILQDYNFVCKCEVCEGNWSAL